LEGNTLRASRIELLRTGLQVGEVSSISMSDQSADTVVVQSPRPGGGATTPKVDVLVSQGRRETSFVMPRLIGLAETDAQHRLDVAGPRPKANLVPAPQGPPASVIDQSPAPGQRIPASALIELTIAN